MNRTTNELVLGAVYDFLDHCCKRENPLVVGQTYSRERVIKEFEVWAKSRNLPINEINIETFRRACTGGLNA